MPTFKVILTYDGTHYAGWQSQPAGGTLQDAFERALERVTGESLRVSASGRTDAGVHALGQVVSFTSDTLLSPEVLVKAFNANLPRDMAVLDCREAAAGFHARRSAIGKRYRYVIDDGRQRDVFARHFVWQYREPLDASAMHRAAQALIGTHDFSSFETQGSPRETSVRTVRELTVERLPGTQRIHLEIEADGFLYNMVRAIVGTLVEVGRGRESEAWPAEVLAARDRRRAGQTAPPQGLFLVRVDYPA